MTDHASVVQSLAALGHDTRLAIFRLLMRAGDEGLIVGEIGRYMETAPSTLAHHLKSLVDAGLVIQERRGREIVNRVDYEAMHRIVGFLTEECCVGVTLADDAAA